MVVHRQSAGVNVRRPPGRGRTSLVLFCWTVLLGQAAAYHHRMGTVPAVWLTLFTGPV